ARRWEGPRAHRPARPTCPGHRRRSAGPRGAPPPAHAHPPRPGTRVGRFSRVGAGMLSGCSRPARFVAEALDPAPAVRPQSCPRLRNGGGAGQVWGHGYVNLGALLMNEIAKQHLGAHFSPCLSRSCDTSRYTQGTGEGGVGASEPQHGGCAASYRRRPSARPAALATEPISGVSPARCFAWGAPIGRGQPARARPTCWRLPLVRWRGSC
ncbi:hypothetical protein Nmel_004342, partial [Mimus melanotis]